MSEKDLLRALNEARRKRGKPLLDALPKEPFCSFCGQGNREARLIAGDAAVICSECVLEAQRQLRKDA
jgi:hypothetical protein